MIELSEKELQDIINALKEGNASIKSAWGEGDETITTLIKKLELKQWRDG